MPNYNVNLTKIQYYPKANEPKYATATKYDIRYNGNLPAGAHVYFCVGDAGNRIEITGGYSTATHLPQLIRCFRRCAQWGQDVNCWLNVEVSGYDPNLPASEIKQIRTPVQPIDWPLNTRKIATAAPALTYPGNGWGRVLSEQFDGQRYFYIAGGFETNPAYRGFDCTSFPEALYCDLFPNGYPDLSAGNSGPIIADALGAQACDMEAKDGETLRQLLLDRQDEISVYLVWRHYSHILLCKVDTVAGSRWFHEFNLGGYLRTPLAERELSGTFTARRLPAVPWDFVRRVETLAANAQQQGGGAPGSQPGSGAPGAKPGTGNGTGNGGNGTPANGGGQTYVVKSGDSLSLISGKYWSDVLLWPILYDANRNVVGPDPNKIVPNQKLSVPNIKNYSSQQLSDARSRGRNWR